MTLQAYTPWAVPRPGELIGGKYLVEGECGRGGLAVVLAAVHQGLNRRVAIKLLRPEWSGHKDAFDRFLREGYAPASMRGEHSVRVFDVDRLDSGAPYFVFEYLDGEDLQRLLKVHGPLEVGIAVNWTLQAAEALGEAHGRGVVHRDVKPSNLVLTTGVDGGCCIKVIDFGLAKIQGVTSNGSTLPTAAVPPGSPPYMAPEQLRAREIDHRVDIWGLGAVLHELLTGEAPFTAPSIVELYVAILTRDPVRVSSVRADVPDELASAIQRCLEKDPERRFQSMAELAAALAPFRASAPRESGVRDARPSIQQPEEYADGSAASGAVALEREPSPFEPPPSPPSPSPPAPAVIDDLAMARSVAEDSGPVEVPFRAPASTGVVLPSLLALGCLGAASLFGAHYLVHRHDAERLEHLQRAVSPSSLEPAPPESSTTPSGSAPIPASEPERATAKTPALHSARPASTESQSHRGRKATRGAGELAPWPEEPGPPEDPAEETP